MTRWLGLGWLVGCTLLAAACSESTPAGSSSSSGEPVSETDASTVDVDPRCPAAFSARAESLVCAAPEATCAGSAVASGGLDLTLADPSVDDGQAGVYWRKLGLSRDAAFTLTVDVSTRQPPGGGIQGHGFALAFVQDDAEPIAAPGVRAEQPSSLGLNVLEGFHGAAAYVKTYNGGTSGVLALRTTQIPSAAETEVDDWNGAVGNAETFGREDSVYLRFVIVVTPGADPTVEMLRFSDATYGDGRSIQTTTIALPALDRFDYFGVAAARGNDGFSQSGHRLEALSLTCPL